MADWLDLIRLDPAYRAHFPDGSTLDVIADTGPDGRRDLPRLRRPGGRRLPALRRLRPRACGTCSATTSSTATWTRPRDLLHREPAAADRRRAASGGWTPKIAQFFTDPRTRRIFSFQSHVRRPRAAPSARALRGHRLPGRRRRRLLPARRHPRGAAGARRRGREARRHVPLRAPRSPASRCAPAGPPRCTTADGERIPADVVVLNPDLPVAYRDLLPKTPRRVRRLRHSPSAVVLHVGSKQRYAQDRAPQHPLRAGVAPHLRRGDPARST